MLHKLAIASAALALLGAPVYAQTTTTGPTTTAPSTLGSSRVDANKLIGESIQNRADNATVGKIDSVILDSTGKVDKVVVGVGGFLGMGKKDVAIDWNQLQISDNGRKVTMNADKDQLKAMPEYTWPKNQAHNSVYTPSATTGSGSTGTTTPGRTGTGTH